MNLLDRLVFRAFMKTWLGVVAGILGLLTALDLLGHGEEISESGEIFGAIGLDVLFLAGLQFPFMLVQYGPFLTLIAGLITVLKFAKHREWMPQMIAGRSSPQILFPIYLGAATIALAALLLKEVLLPSLASPREELLRKVYHQRPFAMADFSVRTRNDERLQAKLFVPSTGVLIGVEIHGRGSAGRDHLLLADEAIWEDESWRLLGGRELTTGGGPQTVEEFQNPELTPDDFELAYFAAVDPTILSTSQLREVLARDPLHRQASTLIYAGWATPFSYLLLLFLGLPFVFRFDRSSSRGGVAWGMLLALSYFVVDLVFRDLGGRGALSPFLGGWGALLLLGSFGFTLKRQF
ncbi:MAG: LptF/LptG family permease [Planctomycetes bacterium]|nr:LptF/LptG family permease [Planctomycetota bacterium]